MRRASHFEAMFPRVAAIFGAGLVGFGLMAGSIGHMALGGTLLMSLIVVYMEDGLPR